MFHADGWFAFLYSNTMNNMCRDTKFGGCLIRAFVNVMISAFYSPFKPKHFLELVVDIRKLSKLITVVELNGNNGNDIFQVVELQETLENYVFFVNAGRYQAIQQAQMKQQTQYWWLHSQHIMTAYNEMVVEVTKSKMESDQF